MTDITIDQRARELLAAEYRRLGERHNVPELIADAETIEAGEEWDFWMDAAHAAVEAALRLSAGEGVVEPKGWREFIEECATMRGKMVVGNSLAEKAKRRLAAAPRHETGEG